MWHPPKVAEKTSPTTKIISQKARQNLNKKYNTRKTSKMGTIKTQSTPRDKKGDRRSLSKSLDEDLIIIEDMSNETKENGSMGDKYTGSADEKDVFFDSYMDPSDILNECSGENGSNAELQEMHVEDEDHNTDKEIKATPLKVPTGMVNTGNSCFLNAVIQALNNVDCLLNYLKTANRGKVTMQMKALSITLQKQNNKIIVPDILHKTVKQQYPKFANKGQQDAHELLMILVERMVEEEADGGGMKDKIKGQLENLVYGKILNKWECSGCQNIVIKEDKYNCLFGSFPQENEDDEDKETDKENLMSTIEREMKSENIEFNCEKCSSKNAIQSSEIEEYPKILFVNLKRFEFDAKGQGKIHKHVEIPLSMDNGRLELKSVVNHIGESMEVGHYIAMCRHKPQQWYMYDDVETEPIHEREIQTGDAYILIYEEKKNRRSDRNTIKSRKLKELEEQNQKIKQTKNGTSDILDATLPYSIA